MKRVMTAAVIWLLVLAVDYRQVEAAEVYDCKEGRHLYEVTISRRAGAEEDGIRVYTCTQCTEVWQETIPKLGHNYGEWIIQKAADCVSEGLRYRVCRDEIHAEEVRQEEVLPAGAHNYRADPEQSTLASCESDGAVVRVCTGCGQEQQEIQPASGHDYAEWQVTKEATLLQPGSRMRVCSRDPAHIETEVIARGISNLNSADKVLLTANTTSVLVLLALVRYDYAVILWNKRKLRKLLMKGKRL